LRICCICIFQSTGLSNQSSVATTGSISTSTGT
jgi:hypothetical protein